LKNLISAVLVILLLTTVIVSGLSDIHISSAQSFGSSFSWWNTNYVFERNITVTNPFNQSFQMKPVLINLNFEPGHLLSAIKEVRIVNATGYEIPSFIVSENYTGGFVTSALILFLVNIAPNSSQTYQIYYGNPSSSVPSYRSSSSSTILHSGVLTLSSQGYQQGSVLNISIANTFFLSLYDKLSFSNPQSQEFGFSQIASSSYEIQKQWKTIGTVAQYNFTASKLVLNAGPVQITKLLIAYNDTFNLLTFVSNPSNNQINSLQITQLFDLSQLASFGVSGVVYNSSSNILYGYVGDTYSGISSNYTPQIVDAGSVQSIINATRLDNLTNSYTSGGPSAAAISYSIGQLQPSASFHLETVWSVSSSSSSLAAQIESQFKNLIVTLGNEVFYNQYLPDSAILWNAAFSRSNLTLPSTGTSVSIPLKGLSWVPESLSYNSLIYYDVPSPSFATASSVWYTKTSFSGNASSYASSKYFSTVLGTFTGRVASWVFTPNATSSAMLLSNNYTVLNSLGTNLSLLYSADIASSSLSSKIPYAYLALDIDPTLRGNFTNTIVFPIAGSSTPANTTLASNLIADGNWHRLSISLNSLLNYSTFEFRLRIIAYSPPGFVGQVELNFGEASISWSTPANDLLSASLGYTSPTLTFSYKPLKFSPPPTGILSFNSSFLLAQQLNFTPSSGSSFSAITASPKGNVSLTPSSMIVYSSYSSMNPSIYFNSTKVASLQLLSPVLLIPYNEIPIRQATNISFTAVNLNFTGNQMKVVVLNSDKNPVQGASVLINPLGSTLRIALKTDSSGMATLQLVPWTYLVNVYYQNYQLYSVFVGLDKPQTLTINASVYNIIVEAKTEGGKPLTNYPISVSTGNFTIQGMTDLNGMFNFPAVANAIYVVILTQPDGSQLSQALRASMNNEVFSITTPYHSAQTQLLIETAAAVAIVIAALALYVFSRRGST
jgi:hypothetical protein